MKKFNNGEVPLDRITFNNYFNGNIDWKPIRYKHYKFSLTQDYIDENEEKINTFNESSNFIKRFITPLYI